MNVQGTFSYRDGIDHEHYDGTFGLCTLGVLLLDETTHQQTLIPWTSIISLTTDAREVAFGGPTAREICYRPLPASMRDEDQ